MCTQIIQQTKPTRSRGNDQITFKSYRGTKPYSWAKEIIASIASERDGRN